MKEEIWYKFEDLFLIEATIVDKIDFVKQLIGINAYDGDKKIGKISSYAFNDDGLFLKIELDQKKENFR